MRKGRDGRCFREPGFVNFDCQSVVVDGIALKDRSGPPGFAAGADPVTALRALPLGILWKGFAVNSASYAALVWLLVLSPATIRRFIRIRRCACPSCGYDLRGQTSPGCPECGAGRAASL